MKITKSLLIALLASTIAGHCYAEKIAEEQLKWHKKYQKHKNIIAVEEALINTDKEPDLTTGFTNLYNGKNLDGWVTRGGSCEFQADGEFIRGACKSRKPPSTFLCTEKEDYKNFIFTAEINWEVDSNTGIMFRSKRRENDAKEIVYGLQCEVEGFAKQRGWTGGIYGQNAGGWVYPLWLEAHNEVRQSLKKDAWNRVTIQCVDEVIQTWVNGEPAAKLHNTKYNEGFFGLQVHFGPKGTVLFKNIKVKELPESTEKETPKEEVSSHLSTPETTDK